LIARVTTAVEQATRFTLPGPFLSTAITGWIFRKIEKVCRVGTAEFAAMENVFSIKVTMRVESISRRLSQVK